MLDHYINKNQEAVGISEYDAYKKHCTRREGERSRRKDHRKSFTDDDHRVIQRQVIPNVCQHPPPTSLLTYRYPVAVRPLVTAFVSCSCTSSASRYPNSVSF